MKNRWLVLLLVGFSGFVSLSYEIIWVRVMSFATFSAAYTFPMTLGLFLTGIAIGSRISLRFSKKYDTRSPETMRVIAAFLLAGGLLGWLIVPILIRWVTISGKIPIFVSLYFICAAAALLGAQFPLITHYGIDPDEEAGANLSYCYLSNIIGSVLGSLLTGFVFLDKFSLPQITTGLACVSMLMGLVLFVMSSPPKNRLIQVALASILACGAIIGLQDVMHDRIWSRLMYKGEYAEKKPFKHIITNKSGVITVTEDDKVYGGGVYDGQFSTSIHKDVNGIQRPYALSLFHPKIERVLVIGVASGSWLKVIAAHPQVKEIVAIEINPGYLDLIKKYPSYAPMLKDPKIKIVVDDGRRWLHTNNTKFDAVVLNTTFFWRSMASSLLSVEFFEMIKSHMTPIGIVIFNTTGSDAVFNTANHVFKETYRYFNNGISSPKKMDIDVERLKRIWKQYKMDGEPIFDMKNPKHVAQWKSLIGDFEHPADEKEESPENIVFEAPSSLRKRTKHLKVYTDRNMGGEFHWRRTLGLSSGGSGE